MEHESFESAAIAAVLNEQFVAIKVDREERPDVDRVYMTFVQATTGSGGWPMSVWLTPDLKPFYGGTYFPPESKWGRPGFVDILQEIGRVWKAERGKVVESADALTVRLRSMEQAAPSTDVPGIAALETTVQQFRSAFDPRNGGFGDAPKFPRPSELLFLLREHARANAPQAAECCARSVRWPSAACAITWAAVFTAIRLTAVGACRISRKCCTTRRSSRSRSWRRRRCPAIRSTRRWRRTRSCTSSAR
jgi:uncharacterized protein YyaL (SSP411 family)